MMLHNSLRALCKLLSLIQGGSIAAGGCLSPAHRHQGQDERVLPDQAVEVKEKKSPQYSSQASPKCLDALYQKR
jgi:hypothetical protein